MTANLVFTGSTPVVHSNSNPVFTGFFNSKNMTEEIKKLTKRQVLALMNVDSIVAKKHKILTYIMDDDNPYEDREEVYLATPKPLYNHHTWILQLDDFDQKYGELSWYEEFYCERYETVDLVGLIKDRFLEDIDLIDEDKWPQEKRNDFIKACVDSGYHSFCFDW